jgi:hypothetical protein
MTTIYDAAVQRFGTGSYVYAHEPFADETVWKDNPIKDKTGKTIGYESGIGIDCSDLVAQALWAAQFDVTYLHTLRYSALWATG